MKAASTTVSLSQTKTLLQFCEHLFTFNSNLENWVSNFNFAEMSSLGCNGKENLNTDLVKGLLIFLFWDNINSGTSTLILNICAKEMIWAFKKKCTKGYTPLLFDKKKFSLHCPQPRMAIIWQLYSHIRFNRIKVTPPHLKTIYCVYTFSQCREGKLRIQKRSSLVAQ